MLAVLEMECHLHRHHHCDSDNSVSGAGSSSSCSSVIKLASKPGLYSHCHPYVLSEALG